MSGSGGQAGGVLEDGRHGEAAHAVAGVDDDPQRADLREVDEAAQERGVVGEQVAVHVVTGRHVGVGDLAGEDPLRELAHLGEAAVLPHRAGPGRGTA